MFLLSLYCTHCIGQQLVLYLALLSCSLCYVKLHVVHVLLFEQIKKGGRKELLIREYHKKHFRWWNIFNVMCRTSRRSFWSWFDVYRYIFWRAKNDFYIRFQWPWPLDLKFALLVTLAERCFTKLEFSTAFLFRENQRHGTDGQTDGRGATLMWPPSEEQIFIWTLNEK